MIKKNKKLMLFIFILGFASGCAHQTQKQVLQKNNIQLEKYILSDLSIIHNRLHPDYNIIEVKDSSNQNEMTSLAIEIGAELVLKSITNVSGGSTSVVGYSTNTKIGGGVSVTPNYSVSRATTRANYYFLKKNHEYKKEVIKLIVDNPENLKLEDNVYSWIMPNNTLLDSSSYRLGYDDTYFYFFESNYLGNIESYKPVIKVKITTNEGVGEETVIETETFPISLVKIISFQGEDGTEKYAYYFRNDASYDPSSVFFRVRPNGRKAVDIK